MLRCSDYLINPLTFRTIWNVAVLKPYCAINGVAPGHFIVIRIPTVVFMFWGRESHKSFRETMLVWFYCIPALAIYIIDSSILGSKIIKSLWTSSTFCTTCKTNCANSNIILASMLDLKKKVIWISDLQSNKGNIIMF